jgi:predicted RNA methylase
MTEASKILPRIIDLLREKTVLDLGCGDEKVVPWAVGVDDGSEWEKDKVQPDVNACIGPNWNLRNPERSLQFALLKKGIPGTRDVVFSSHALEHIPKPIRDTLNYWLSFVNQNGHLILYLPDERHYVYDHANRKARNPAHYHYLTPETFQWHLDQIPNIRVEQFEPDIGDDRYSFLVVIRKLST